MPLPQNDIETRHLRASDYTTMAWRNGLGTTLEIAKGPAADSEAFGWRVSLATLSGAGPFSTFSGYDRIIVQTEGPSMGLDHGPFGRTRLSLLTPYAFSGDIETQSFFEPPASPHSPRLAQDFNVMTRRNAFQAHVQCLRLEPGASAPVQALGDAVLVYCVHGACHIRSSLTQGTFRLEGTETLLLSSLNAAAPTTGRALRHQLLALAPTTSALIVVSLTATPSA